MSTQHTEHRWEQPHQDHLLASAAERGVTAGDDINDSIIITGENNQVTQEKIAGDKIMGDSTSIGSIANSIVALGRHAVVNAFPNRQALKAHQHRNEMLTTVKQIWIDGILTASLYEGVAMETTFSPVPDAVSGDPLTRRMHLPPTASASAIPTAQIADYFNGLGSHKRTLLILGEPGSGKTTAMLMLARQVIAQAMQDGVAPIPIIFHLASWSKQRLPLAQWLVAEFKELYAVAEKQAGHWVQQAELLLLLDGLDEVEERYQAACVAAINRFVADYKLATVVCCRQQEYTQLPVPLDFTAAVQLNRPDQESIEHYLETVNPSRSNHLHQLIKKNATIQEMAQSPLMLNTMLQAYEETAVTSQAPAVSLAEYREQLFDTYIHQRLSQIGKLRGSYPDQQTIQWLIWLARQLLRHNQSIFLIEKLQPDWLSSRQLRWAYFLLSRASLALVSGLIGGLVLGIGFAVYEERWLEGVTRGLVEGGLAGLIAGLVVAGIDLWRMELLDDQWQLHRNAGLLRLAMMILLISTGVGVTVWIGMGSILGALEFSGSDWNFWFQRESKYVGLLVGLCFGLIFGYGSRGIRHILQDDVLATERLQWSRYEALIGAVYGLVGGIATVLILLIVDVKRYVIPLADLFPGVNLIYLSLATLTIFGALLGGLTSQIVVETARPNQGMVRAKMNMLLIGGRVGIAFGLVGAISALLVDPTWQAIVTMTIYGLFFGILAAIWYGGLDLTKHGWLRLFLTRCGHMPGNYAHFLDYASERILLRKVGGGYIFAHRLLMEHFAQLANEQVK